MSAVTYLNQKGIHATHGTVGVAGNDYPYRVGKVLWPSEVEDYLRARIVGKSLHLFCGKSQLGDVRVDIDPDNHPTLCGDLFDKSFLNKFESKSFDTVLLDPPYNAKFQKMHDVLNAVHRIARSRIIFQHWFAPLNRKGQFKKANLFVYKELAVVPSYADILIRDGDDFVYVKEDTGPGFLMSEISAWQPNTYFGRVQLITVMDYESTNYPQRSE